MTMTKFPVLLQEQHALALGKLAKSEYRDIAQQAAVIIRDELIRRGLLQGSDQITTGDASHTQEPQPT